MHKHWGGAKLCEKSIRNGFGPQGNDGRSNNEIDMGMRNKMKIHFTLPLQSGARNQNYHTTESQLIPHDWNLSPNEFYPNESQ